MMGHFARHKSRIGLDPCVEQCPYHRWPIEYLPPSDERREHRNLVGKPSCPWWWC